MEKKIANFINKLFKMGDKYLVENNNQPGSTEISRAYVNASFEAYRKKKEQRKQRETAPEGA